MAIQHIIRKTDDLTGAEGAETRPFTFGGVEYEVELTDETVEKIFGELLKVARRTGGRKAPSGRAATSPAPTAAEKTERQATREWLRSKGYDVADRGQIKAEWQELYRNRDVVPIDKATPAKVAKKAAKKATATAALNSGPKRAVHVPLQGVSRNAAIRSWAARNNLPVPSKGRIPGHVVDAWKAAGSPSIDDFVKVG
jgi:hypothetical protein